VDVAETLLVYAGIPLGIVVVIVLLNLRGARRRARYRPGQPWSYPPVWYEPHPLHPAAQHGSGQGELEVGHSGHADVDRAGAGPVLGSGAGQPSGHPGGPLGGARGTW
jgi:hypothetical protein